MSLADEIEKLQTLRDQGTLSEQEFIRAKAALLDGSSSSPAPRPEPRPVRGSSSEDETLNTVLKWSAIIYIGLSLVGTIVGVWVFLTFFKPMWNAATP